MIEAKLADTNGSSTTGQRRLAGWRRAVQRERAVGGLVPDRLGVELRPGRGRAANPMPVIRSAPSPANAYAYA